MRGRWEWLKKLSFIVLIMGTVASFVACGRSAVNPGEALSPQKSTHSESTSHEVEVPQLDRPKLRVTATIFPIYDLVRAVGGEAIELDLMVPPQADLHLYEPSVQSLAKAYEADLIVQVGGHSEAWMERIKSSLQVEKTKVLNLLSKMDALEVEETLGMQGLSPELHSHDSANGGGEHEEAESSDDEKKREHSTSEAMPSGSIDSLQEGITELDEHIWTSPKRAIQIVEWVRIELTSLRPELKAYFDEKAKVYRGKLEELSQQIEKIVQGGKRRVLVFGDRFPFRYFIHDYHLDYDAAFPGCSTEIEPSVSGLLSLSNFIREEEIPFVLYLEGSNQRVAKLLHEETGAELREFHSLHRVTEEEFKRGVGYLDLMKRNLSVLEEVLN